jgi:hypothetical protein
MIWNKNIIKLDARNQLLVGEGLRLIVSSISVRLTITFTTNDITNPKIITIFFKNSTEIKLCV